MYERKVDLPHAGSPRRRIVTEGGASINWWWLDDFTALKHKDKLFYDCRKRLRNEAYLDDFEAIQIPNTNQIICP